MRKALKYECLLCWKFVIVIPQIEINGGDYIKIKEISKNKQSKTYEMLKNYIDDEKEDDKLSFKDFEKMMRHDSYKRRRGSIHQIKHE